ncbi:uric acid degradation bifunctional protein TTL-like [Arachis duranensis]|uniref:Uric acid degradation bifunctional protein TTL-like n=1 Tax=Arachis duranensis TaxID=130453 RepID=A0A6P4D275_ARADU|nr:uric acid degradation bifunctional protein TTL-like [Arachis duranensis]
MEERDLLECCGSIKFASEMASASPFSSLQHALDVASNTWCNKILDVASNIWCNKINVHSWLIALNAHTNICEKSPFSHAFYTNAPMDSITEEIYALSVQYLQRYGFPYFTISFEWDADVILMDLKKGYIRSTTESAETQAAVKDFDLNKSRYGRRIWILLLVKKLDNFVKFDIQENIMSSVLLI